MQFNGFASNHKAKQLLSAFVDEERLPHALVIEGPEGSGKRTLARLLAQAAVCTAKTEKPCGHCSACIKAKSGNHPDICEVGGDGSSRSFHIDVIRNIREDVYILPNEANRRIIILTGAQGMTEQAQNALLKILEEPPRHILFILTCDNRARLLTTIRSRTVCVTLGAVDSQQAVSVIQRILPHVTKEEANNSAIVFGGIIGQAIRGLEDGSFKRVLELAPQIATAVTAPNELELLRLTAYMEKDKKTLDGILKALALIFRDALIRQFGAVKDISVSPETAKQLSHTLTREQLGSLIQAVDKLQCARQQNINYTLLLTLLCSRLRSSAGR